MLRTEKKDSMKDNEIRDLGAVNMIAQGTQVEGSVVTNSDCRIDGHVKGNVTSKSKIIIGRSGFVEGNITCNSVEIEGTVKAETLNVSDLMTLKSSAKLQGNIVVGKIAIEPGAEFSGNCKMQTTKAPVAPQPERK